MGFLLQVFPGKYRRGLNFRVWLARIRSFWGVLKMIRATQKELTKSGLKQAHP